MNKKVFCLTIMVVLLLGFGASASSFQVDATYVFGNGQGMQKYENKGFLVTAQASIFSEILVDGLFLSTNVFKLDGEEVAAGEGFSEKIMAGGAKYLVSADSDLDVFVGAGWLNHKVEEFEGSGIYGKFGFDFQLHPQVNLVGDLCYAPKFKNDEDKGSFLSGRVSVSYEVYNDLGVQGSLMHSSAKIGGQENSGLVYGGGLIIRF